ncbi:hypothetical protein [Nonomuraea sp. CA-141351]|uniref:hypothetical protein n=1 Tax=Nonomuraea sp. CA-141351 TaxID=3239996 RepID=UPI003D8FF076
MNGRVFRREPLRRRAAPPPAPPEPLDVHSRTFALLWAAVAALALAICVLTWLLLRGGI